MDLINNRQWGRFKEPSNKEVEEMVDTATAQVDEEEDQEAEREYQHSVENDDSPIYGNLSVDHKDDNVFRFLSVNINGLPFWLRLQQNHKAELLKLSYLSVTMWSALVTGNLHQLEQVQGVTDGMINTTGWQDSYPFCPIIQVP